MRVATRCCGRTGVSALLELQVAFAETLRSGKPTGVESLVACEGISAAGRIAVYRNHFLISLGDALATAFPVVRRLVGEAYFSAAARRFVQESPPRSPCISEYGQEFADFLRRLPEIEQLAYVADVACLEWALVRAAEADELPGVPPERLATLDPGRLAGTRLTLHPSVGLLASGFPIDRIWRVNQACGEPPIVDLTAGGVRLLVHRCGGEVGWTALETADFTFATDLARGLSIEQASMRASLNHNEFNPAAVFSLLLSRDLIVAFSVLPMEECLQ